jgi:DNA-binding response OmpR family regulator
MVREQSPDLLILDLMLPTMSGFDVCRAIRGESAMPIIMLTAKGEEVDRVVGLELGADDYVIKPFSMRELVARVKAVLRRSQLTRESGKEDVIRAGDLIIDCARHVVRIRDKTLHLPLKEFELLHLLAKNKDRVLTRDVLLSRVWGGDAYDSTRTLDVHIRWLREKVEDDPSVPKRIVTVRGVGYMFVGQSHDQAD